MPWRTEKNARPFGGRALGLLALREALGLSANGPATDGIASRPKAEKEETGRLWSSSRTRARAGADPLRDLPEDRETKQSATAYSRVEVGERGTAGDIAPVDVTRVEVTAPERRAVGIEVQREP